MKYYILILILVNSFLIAFDMAVSETWVISTFLNIMILPFLFWHIQKFVLIKSIEKNQIKDIHSFKNHIISDGLSYFKTSFGLILILYPILFYSCLSGFQLGISDLFYLVALIFLSVNISIISVTLIRMNSTYLPFFISVNGIVFSTMVVFYNESFLLKYLAISVLFTFVVILALGYYKFKTFNIQKPSQG